MQAFGKERSADDIVPSEFARLREIIAKGKRPKTIHNMITRCMAVINFSNKNGLTDRPILTGTYFEKLTAREIRIDRAAQDHNGELMFSAKQIREALSESRVQMKAMILLAINVGVGNEDCGRLEFRHVDLVGGWLDFPRPKSGVKRRAKLWPETVEVIRSVIAERKPPKDKALSDFVFLTRYGMAWWKEGRANPRRRVGSRTRIPLANSHA